MKKKSEVRKKQAAKLAKVAGLKVCKCRKPDFGTCTPVCMCDEGRLLLELNRKFIGWLVCYGCGGVALRKPRKFNHMMGETVIRRLAVLGIADCPERLREKIKREQAQMFPIASAKQVVRGMM